MSLHSTLAKSRPNTIAAHGYLEWSRDPAVGLFAVLPLWLCYEGLRLTLAPSDRNGAEFMVSAILAGFGPTAMVVLRALFAVTVLAAAISIHRRSLPWFRIALVTALEGIVYALVLGPLASALTANSLQMLSVGEVPGAAAGREIMRDLVGSLGAGIFEEILFRLVLLSLLALACTRAAVSFGLPRAVGVVVAILISALVFSLFHHVGSGGAPLESSVFLFRAIAGLLLGTVFVVRGFGVCVYAHAFYDVHYYLSQ